MKKTTRQLNLKDKKPMRTIECSCGHKFTQVMIMLHNYDDEGKTIVEGFWCRKCKKEFVAKVTNNELRRGLAQQDDLAYVLKKTKKLAKNEISSYKKYKGFVLPEIHERWERRVKIAHTEYMECKLRNKALAVKLKHEYVQSLQSK